jgi:AsmA protein
MSRILKVVTIVGVAVVALLGLTMIGLSMFFDPNNYKSEIAGAVERSTGRQLTLEGDLGLNVFPRLRIAVGSAELANAAGFGAEPFASIQSAGLAVGLFPLLAGRIEIAEARLEGLVLNLARDSQGRNNWQDMSGGAVAPVNVETTADAGGDTDLDLDIGAIVIAEAEINWSDASAGSNWQLGNFNLDAAGLGPGPAIPLDLDFTVSGDDLDLSVSASMDATLGLADNRYRLGDLDIEMVGEGSAWPGGQGEIALGFEIFEADLQAETVSLEGLVLEVLGLTINGSLDGEELFGDLALNGEIEIEQFDPQELLETLNLEIATADTDVLREISLSGNLNYDANQMTLNGLDLTLDDSNLTGSLGRVGSETRFDLAIDSINVDRYLPPAAEGPAEGEGSLDEVDLPLAALRELDANGQFTIDSAQISGLSLSDVSFVLTAGDGLVSLQPSASLYSGSFGGEITIRASGDSANLAIDQELSGIDMTPLGQDLLDAELISGTMNASLDLAAMGSNLGEIRRQLDGNVAFALTDGAWNGVDMWYELRRARASLESAPAPEAPAEGEARTAFSEVSTSGVLDNGVLTTRNLIADVGFMAVTGGGTLDLVADAMNFDLVAQFIDGPMLQSDPEMADLAGDELPLKVSGSPTSPSILPDFAAMIRAEVEAAVEEEIQEEREQLQERLNDRLRGVFDR